MGAVDVSGELEELVGRELEDLLEPAADGHEDLLSLISRSALATGNIAISTARNALADCASPDTNAEEGLPDIDDHTHHLSVILTLEGLADGGKHSMEPELIDVDQTLVLEAVRPLATVLVLGVLPLGTDVLLEEVVVRLVCKLRDRSDVVLSRLR